MSAHSQLDGHNEQRRLIALQRIVADLANRSHDGDHLERLPDIYEFGVLAGFGLGAWTQAMPRLNLSLDGVAVWGFDSFAGMPDEPAGFMRPIHIHDRSWQPGGLNSARWVRCDGTCVLWPSLEKALKRNIGFDPQRTTLVRGFYNEKPASRRRACRAPRHAPSHFAGHRLRPVHEYEAGDALHA